MKKLTVAVLLSSFVAAPAFAADTSWYGGINVGRSKTSVPLGTVLARSGDNVFGALVGYKLDKNLSAEVFYTSAGKSAWYDSGNTQRSSAYTDAAGIVGVGMLPLSDTFSLYGKLGYASTNTTLACTVIATGVDCAANGPKGDTRGRATFGFGLKFDASPDVGVRFGCDRYGAAITSAIGDKIKFNSHICSVGALFKL